MRATVPTPSAGGITPEAAAGAEADSTGRPKLLFSPTMAHSSQDIRHWIASTCLTSSGRFPDSSASFWQRCKPPSTFSTRLKRAFWNWSRALVAASACSRRLQMHRSSSSERVAATFATFVTSFASGTRRASNTFPTSCAVARGPTGLGLFESLATLSRSFFIWSLSPSTCSSFNFSRAPSNFPKRCEISAGGCCCSCKASTAEVKTSKRSSNTTRRALLGAAMALVSPPPSSCCSNRDAFDAKAATASATLPPMGPPGGRKDASGSRQPLSSE
mmetsp:Transcript_63008/g.146730  ORF Transcript_63008/g.146730 Transcript_63008/m.146730 type:complete len:274 (-) Transcript_63008:1042-1863(-)